MKQLLTIFTLMLAVQFGHAQENPNISAEDRLVRIELNTQDAQKAKSLKNLNSGKLYKGESATVFLIKTKEEKVEAVRKELLDLFPTCKIDQVKGDE